MQPLNPPPSTPSLVTEKAHRQTWSDAERKQICEYRVSGGYTRQLQKYWDTPVTLTHVALAGLRMRANEDVKYQHFTLN